jgi:hypothetical protein
MIESAVVVRSVGGCLLRQGRIETAKGLFRRSMQVHNLPSTNQKDGVGAFGGYRVGIKAHDGEFV